MSNHTWDALDRVIKREASVVDLRPGNLFGQERKQKVVDRIPPTEQDWSDYWEAKALYASLRESRFFEEGGPDYGNEVVEPEPTLVFDWAETEEEYAARLENIKRRQASMPPYKPSAPEPMFDPETWARFKERMGATRTFDNGASHE